MFDPRTDRNLKGVHPELVHLLRTFDPPYPMVVTEGVRTLEKQKEYYETGKSQTMNSRHLKRVPQQGGNAVSHAVDIAVFPQGLDKEVSWDWSFYADVAADLKQHAKNLRIPITWGGDWTSRDGVHFQLTWADYPVWVGEASPPPQPQILSVEPTPPPTAQIQPSSKRPETSTTVAAAGGVSAIAIGEHILRWLEGVDTTWAEYAVLAVLLVMAGWIVKERVARLDQEGV